MFSCSPSGIIQNISHNELFPDSKKIIGKGFPAILEPHDIRKGLNFIQEINTYQYSFNYYLDLKVDNQKISLYLIGLKTDDEILIIGSENHQEAITLIEEMQKINNEQTNFIRRLVKEKFDSPQSDNKEFQALFNEISRINNELINLQRELTPKNLELERLNNLKNSFIGMATHDLRNPLGVIQNYAEFLADDTSHNLTDKQRWMLEVIQKSAQFMLGLVEDLLDYNKIESGKLELSMDSVNLPRTIEHWVAVHGQLANRKGIAFKFIAPNIDIIIDTDIRKLEQVFNNLVSNAIKFSYPESQITVTLTTENGFAVLGVKDQGIGMSPDQLDKLFKPFTRIATEGTAGEKCTGLGLSIVKRIVDGHGGRIEVKSAPNQGSEFKVYLPINIK